MYRYGYIYLSIYIYMSMSFITWSIIDQPLLSLMEMCLFNIGLLNTSCAAIKTVYNGERLSTSTLFSFPPNTHAIHHDIIWLCMHLLLGEKAGIFLLAVRDMYVYGRLSRWRRDLAVTSGSCFSCLYYPQRQRKRKRVISMQYSFVSIVVLS